MADATQATEAGGSGAWSLNVMAVEDSPATTSAVTYTVRIGPNAAGTVRLNGTTATRDFGGASRAVLIVQEVKG